MMARGDSVGVFQFESEGMRESLRKVNPTEFEDLVALVALYRPGAMDQIPAYSRGKRNPESIAYIDDRLVPITESTKGVILYQEQAMQIAKSLANFTGPQADDLRKAIGKKNRVAMAKLQPMFIEGCRANGVSNDVIESLWATNEKSADYSFNKSHAACYALISYRTAWLKANYPAEYMAALISSVMDTKDKVPFFVNQAEQMGIEHPAAGREPLRPRVHRRGRQHPLRAGRREGRRLRRGGGDQGRPRGRPVHEHLGLLRTRRRPRRQQALDRGAHPVRRVRVHRRHAPRACSTCWTPRSPPASARSRTRRWARARSSTCSTRVAERIRPPPRRAIRRSRRTSSSATSC